MTDIRQIGNDALLNIVTLELYQRFLAEHFSSPGDSNFVNAAKMGLVLTGVEEFKRWAQRQGFNLSIF